MARYSSGTASPKLTPPPDPTLADGLMRIDQTLERIEKTEQRIESEVKRWDDRFFKFLEDTANRSLTLIAGATIASLLESFCCCSKRDPDDGSELKAWWVVGEGFCTRRLF